MAGRFFAALRSLVFYAAFYGGSIGYVAAATLALPAPIRRLLTIGRNWSAYHRTCVERLLGIRVVVEGNWPEGQFLAAVRHESFFEAIGMPDLIAHPSVFAKAELFRLPLWGRVARAYGLIGVERDQGAKALRAMITEAKHRSAEGRSLVIFPEGTRVPHGEQRQLQAGFAGIYKLLGLPVVPVAVDSGPLYHRWIKPRGKITVRIGELIPAGLPRAEIEARVLREINVLNGPETR